MITQEQIDEIIAAKGRRRRAEAETNTGGSHRYCCLTCFHRKTGSCNGLSSLEKVCEYWFDPNSKIQGLAYERGSEQEHKCQKRNNQEKILSAVADFMAGRKNKRTGKRLRAKKDSALLFSKS